MVLVLGAGGRFVLDFTQRRLWYAAGDWFYLMSVSRWGHDASVTLEARHPGAGSLSRAAVSEMLTAGAFAVRMDVPVYDHQPGSGQ